MELDVDIQLAFAKDLVEGLGYLHSAGNVHGTCLACTEYGSDFKRWILLGNLNSSHITVDSNLRAKIGYFGFEKLSQLRPQDSYVYKAPELFVQGTPRSKETDICKKCQPDAKFVSLLSYPFNSNPRRIGHCPGGGLHSASPVCWHDPR